MLQYNVVRTLVGVQVAKDYEFSVVCFNDAMTTGVAMILMNKEAGTGYLANLEASSTMFLDRGMDRMDRWLLILHCAEGREAMTSPDPFVASSLARDFAGINSSRNSLSFSVI